MVKARDALTIGVFGTDKGTPLPSAETDAGKRLARLDGEVLTIADSSGAGFAIASNWTE
jgi:hypothetical protein